MVKVIKNILKKRIPENEMPPPWQVYPTYTRYTIGWRMGVGEHYIMDWHDFIDTLPKRYGCRVAYLQRHCPAPITWANLVWRVLYPKNYDYNRKKHLSQLIKLGLIKHDVAYSNWYQQSELIWPWKFSETPEEMARYRTREFWFFSRYIQSMKKNQNFALEEIPASWQNIEKELQTGNLHNLNLQQGLLALAKMLCVGKILPPWELKFSPGDLQDSFEMDMGYVDAFRLWIIDSFDDDQLLFKILSENKIPSDWNDWLKEQIETIY